MDTVWNTFSTNSEPCQLEGNKRLISSHWNRVSDHLKRQVHLLEQGLSARREELKASPDSLRK
jgi:hypothetical protein